jgi:MoxR-like ATPase
MKDRERGGTMAKEITLNGKRVALSEPFSAFMGDLVGREVELKKIMAAWIARNGSPPQSPLLIGDPGQGKTHLVLEIARLTGKQLYTLQGSEDMTSEDLACTITPGASHDRRWDYKLGPLPTAMITGNVFFLDGIGKMRKKALALLESVMDSRRYLESVLLGETIPAHPDFRFIAATNTSDLEMDEGLPDYIRSRLRPVISFDYPDPETINRILVKKHPSLGQETNRQLIADFWDLWRENGNGSPPAPRDAIEVFKFALNIPHVDYTWDRRPVPLSLAEADLAITREHLGRAFSVFFGPCAERKNP